MMNHKVTEFIEKYNNAISKYSKFLLYSRGIEFQRYSITKLTTLSKELLSIKEEMIQSSDEESANTMLSMEYLLNTYINELEMLIALKEDKMDNAWKSLIEAQHNLRDSFQSSSIVSELGGQNYIRKLYLIEKIFFPPQTFTSIELVVEKVQCSICNEEYGTCNHLKGKPYNGRLCYSIVAKIKETKGLSILTNNCEPGSKLCRITSFLDKGHWRDMMTWRIKKN